MNRFSKAQVPYIALSVHQLNEIEESNQIDSFYQLDYNMATVTIFKNGTATIFPGSGLGEGLLFYDLRAMKKMIDEQTFPVNGDGSFWEAEKHRVINLNEGLDYYYSKVSEILDIPIELNSEKKYLEKISEIINKKYYKRKISNESNYYLSIYIGELIRARNKGRWVLLPEFTLNVYYIPEIIVGNKYCDVIWHVYNRLKEISYLKVDIEEIIGEAKFEPLGNRLFVETNQIK